MSPIIEHNLDVIKTADWLIDMGPEGGAGGGQVLMAGTPEQLAASGLGHTGRYLTVLLSEPAPGAAPVLGKRLTKPGQESPLFGDDLELRDVGKKEKRTQPDPD